MDWADSAGRRCETQSAWNWVYFLSFSSNISETRCETQSSGRCTESLMNPEKFPGRRGETQCRDRACRRNVGLPKGEEEAPGGFAVVGAFFSSKSWRGRWSSSITHCN